MRVPEKVIKQCKEKLLEAKMDILNRFRDARATLMNSDDNRGGDEADQTMRIIAEGEYLSQQERLRDRLAEIEAALARIESGSFGLCEETEEFIETERLLAIPWTRLSIEGAELRESVNKRYAR
jgi:DnaK suppressor protein